MMQTTGSTTLFLVPKGNANQLPLFDPVSFRPFEIWKTIPGYNERYEASSEGRVRRVSGKRSKLTTEDVLAIRVSRLSERALAAQYGVSQVAIHYAKVGKTYRDVPMPEAA